MTSTYQPGGINFFPSPTEVDTSTTYTRQIRDFRNELTITDVIDPKTQKPVPGVKAWTIKIHNVSGGLNRLYGNARQPSMYYPYSDLDRCADGTSDLSYHGVLSLPLLTTKQTSLGNSNANRATPLCHANIFGVMMLAVGGTANKSLFVDSATSPTLTAVTYTPGSLITHIGGVIIGGATSAMNLAVCKETGAVDIIDTSAGHVLGTMAAGTNPAWGTMMGPLNTATPGTQNMLLYAAGSIYAIPSTNTIAAALPAASSTNLPNGGFPIGIIELPGKPLRAYWCMPLENILVSMLDMGQPVPGRIISTNLLGQDPQDVAIEGMPWVFQAIKFGNSIVATDGIRVVRITDRQRDLRIFDQRQSNVSAAVDSNIYFRVGALGEANNSLFAVVVQKNQNVATTATTTLEHWQEENGAWYSVASYQTVTNGGIGSASSYVTRNLVENGSLQGTSYNYACASGLPFSRQTGNIYYGLIDTVANNNACIPCNKFVPPEGYAPYYLYRKTTGAGATTGQQFEASSNFYSPAMLLEGLEGYPSVLESIQYVGDLATGGTGATVQIEVARQANQTFNFTSNTSATFLDTDPIRERYVNFMGNRERFTRLQYRVTITQGTDTRMTPNALPIILKGLTFIDGNVRSPQDVRGTDYFLRP